MVISNSQLSLEDRVIEMMARVLNIPSSKINPYTDLIDDLYLDVLDRSLLIAKLERHFGVVLSTEEVDRIDTVRDTCVLIQKYAS